MSDAEPDVLDVTKTPCGSCGETSSVDEQMVCCDGCDVWSHTRCVGGAAATRGLKWFCKDQACQLKALEYQKQLKVPKKPGSVKSTGSTVEQKVKALEERQRRMEAELEAEMLLKQKEKKMLLALERKKLEIERRLRMEEEEEQMALQAEMLKEKTDRLSRMECRQKAFDKKMSALDKRLSGLKVTDANKKKKKPQDVVDGEKAGTSGKGKQLVLKLTEKNVQKLNESNGQVDDEDEADSEDVDVPGVDEADDKGDDDDIADDVSEEDDGEKDDDDGGNTDGGESSPSETSEKRSSKATSIKDQGDRGSQNRLGPPQTGPTKAQLAARNGITRKLPTFSGKPEEWPLFYGAYQASNTACGYSDVENLVRLQDCLKGQALEMVRGQLLLPQSVPRVITKLRQLYGRPEQLLQSHLDKVRKLDPPKSERLVSFIPFGNAVEQLCEHLEAADLRQHLVNPLLIQDLVEKLPDSEKRRWVRYKRREEEVTLRTFTDFLVDIVGEACEANVSLEYKQIGKPAAGVQSGREKHKERGALFSHSEESNQGAGSRDLKKATPCKACQSTEHRLRSCAEFRKMRYVERLQLVEREKLCSNCLNEHGGRCRFKFRCNVGNCREPHNPLMHPVENVVVGTSAHIRSNCAIMFRMIPVQLHCGGRSIVVLAFLDEGASVTLVDQKLADRLGVVGVPERLTIKWTSDVKREEKESRRMNLWISGVGAGASNKQMLHTVRTVARLMLPRQKLDAVELAAQYTHMQGLSIESYDGQPELLIGLNNINAFAPIELRSGTPVDPIAVRCKLGWTVYGPRHTSTAVASSFLGCHQEITNEVLNDLLKSHYALEESVVAVPQETVEEKRAREILEKTTKRIGDRFETGLLWKRDELRFPDSYPMALRRMKQLEKRLEKNPELRENVCTQIDEYQKKGYAHLATTAELEGFAPDKVWYLPLSVVLNPKKPGKVRLVWDAAAKVDGVSLNSELLKGPDMLVPLVKVIIGFRERRIAFGGDLKEMYHQLKIIDGDKQAQRFIFRKSPEERPSVYVMDVATFGATCSPSSAQYVKNKNAEEHAVQYPEAAAAIIDRHYVDDYFDSVDTVEQAVQLAKQVSLVHKKAGFEIRNWVSNSSEVLKGLGEERPVAPVHFNQDKQTAKERVLGVIWDPDLDEFAFSVMHREELIEYLYGEKRPTKRLVASCVMGFFDPIGFLSPFTIHGKIIIQHLWRRAYTWDQEIDVECWKLWKRWTGLLPEVEKIRVSRSYFGNSVSSAIESLELHIFTDASEHAYGCVAYLRAVIDGKVQCSLVMSRAKVAPLKRQSIPRLELMAAVLGARMNQTVLATHSLRITRTIFWTDSRTVCSWLNSDQHKYKQFVAFRIGEIWELSKVTDWRWVPSKQNMADVMTKWGNGPPLQSDGEWFKAKQFMYLPEDQWPSSKSTFEETEEEARGVVLFHEVINAEAISRWTRLVRVTASVIRFIANCRRKKEGTPIVTSLATVNQQRLIKSQHTAVLRPLEQKELQQAETILWRQAQWDSFPDEMSTLTKNLGRTRGEPLEKIRKSSYVYKCSPVLDDEGVLRMDGRIDQSKEIPFDKKHPIILSRFHEITEKLIQHYHEEFGHANRETVFNEMRQRFQIPKLRSAIQRVTNKCVWCKVNKCRPCVPRMAPLPVQRVTSHLRPFSSVGVDYLGPVEVTVGRRKEKRWVAVFTCLAVRAVHLEVVHSLTTQSCLMAIRRFSCKFGKPNEIFSDNGTCFRGADNEMTRISKIINSKCAESVTSAATAWHFNPPATPHMGGIWERMVRSVKEAMCALDDGRKLTDEILSTTLAEAGDMINTRPLTYVPQESSEAEALTPNHFLRGSVTSADVKVDGTTDLAAALRDVYQRSQYLADRMWERWCREYLPAINQRTGWFDEQEPLKMGDLVFVVDGKNRKCWKRGIVEQIIMGADGRIRQADVRTAAGIHRRSVANLAVLEIQ